MHDVTLTITDVKRIDRSHHGHGKHVTRRAAFTIVAYHVAVVVTIGHVHAHLQPWLQLIVGIQAGSHTLVGRLRCDTVVVEIVHRSIVAAALCSTRCADGVLLAE